MIVKDSMVLIHLAKASLLEISCDYFKEIFIPEKIREEVLDKGYEDGTIILDLIARRKINVKKVQNKSYIERANEFNIRKGEAEAVALYWELDAQLLATDDNNVRKKKNFLMLNVISTPGIILKLYNEKLINKTKFNESIKILRMNSWFSSTIFDKILLEAGKNE